MSTGELPAAIALELPWVRFLDVVFAYETALFIPLFYLIVFKSKNMPEYRWCLTTNVVSMYFFVIGVYLYKPFVLAEGYYFVPLGVVSDLGPSGHFYFLIGVNFLTTCHGLAIATCLLYQAVNMPAAWMAKVPEVVIGFVFRSKTRFIACYFGLAIGIWLMVAAYFLQANVDLEPLKKTSTGTSAKDELLQNYLSQKDGVILLHLEQSQWLLPLSVLLALVICAIIALIVHLTLKNRRMMKNRSAKTARLQIALNLSILAQVTAIVLMYIVPLEIGAVAAVAFRHAAREAYVSAALAHFVLAIYPPLNYTLIFVFVKQYRREVARIAKRIVEKVKNPGRRKRSTSVFHLTHVSATASSNVTRSRRSLPY